MSFRRASDWNRTMALGSVCWLLACSSNPAPEVPLTPWGAESLTWAPCPEDLGGERVDCTQLEVPLNWDEESTSEHTSVLLRRRTSTHGSRGSLWALDGGPGYAGDSFLDPALADLIDASGLDLYIPSHRGTIGASALYCPKAQSASSPSGARVTPEEWPGCLAELEAKWGQGLPAFSVRGGALDVAHALDLAPKHGERYLFGGSYGSLWAQRILLDTDAQLDGALLDSIVPVGASLERVDEASDLAVSQLLTACEELDSCAELFDGSPLSSSREALQRFETGDGCGQAQGVTRLGIQVLARRLLDGPPESWIKLIALYESLVRCNSGDSSALRKLTQKTPDSESTDAGAGPSNLHYNALLNRQLLYRELYRFDESEEERLEFEASALALTESREALRQEAEAFGSDYRVLDPPRQSESAVPTTLLSGLLDPLDRPSWAQDFAQSLESGTLISLPWAGHSTLRYLGWQEGECGRAVFTAFLNGESAALPCTSEQSAPDLGRTKPATQELVNAWFSASR